MKRGTASQEITEFSTPRDPEWKTVPAEATSLISPALDQLRQKPGIAPEEVPGLLERLAEVPDPRRRRGVRHALVVVLALTACAVLAGATFLSAVGEWIADAPPDVLERLGVRPDPLLSRLAPSESSVRRLLTRIDADALDRSAAAGSPTADPRAPGSARWPSTARSWAAPPGPTAEGSTCSRHSSTPVAWSWPNSTWGRRRTRSHASGRSSTRSPTSPMWSSPWMLSAYKRSLVRRRCFARCSS
ncbi:transposase family protein [Streptomyces sp. NPDC046931]|uniref:transposase family protein n=1 Tax=Streptomyces sp. NPDC046931 TaxID=3154806 RepID=UPI003402640F